MQQQLQQQQMVAAGMMYGQPAGMPYGVPVSAMGQPPVYMPMAYPADTFREVAIATYLCHSLPTEDSVHTMSQPASSR